MVFTLSVSECLKTMGCHIVSERFDLKLSNFSKVVVEEWQQLFSSARKFFRERSMQAYMPFAENCVSGGVT